METVNSRRAQEHGLIAATAAIIAAHFLTETGQIQEAVTMGDEGAHLLQEILQRQPALRTQQALGYPYRLWPELEVMGFAYRGTALRKLAERTTATGEKRMLLDYANISLRTALAKAPALPRDANGWYHGLLRDLARLSIHYEEPNTHGVEAVQLAQRAAAGFQDRLSEPDGPLLYALSQATLLDALLDQCDVVNAALALNEMTQATKLAQSKDRVHLGPLHQVIIRRAEAAYYLTVALHAHPQSSHYRDNLATWHSVVASCLRLAQSAGLTDQERVLRMMLCRIPARLRLFALHDDEKTHFVKS